MVALLCVVACTKESFTVWQLPSQIDSIGNSYVVQTAGGKVIVMDGGFAAEKDYLRGFIDALGGKVDAWIISHPHDDHITALIALLENPNGLKIERVYHSRFPDVLIDAESAETAAITRKLYSLLDNATDIEVIDCHCGDEFEIDGVKKIVRPGDSMLKRDSVEHGCVCLEKGILLDIFTPMRKDFVNE